MAENLDSSVIKMTQDTLGKFVKKPPLSEKLLRKPPFRFLHDIVNVVIKDTGYLKGLYSTDELNSENIKDRDGKIKFLQSLIDVVKLSTGKSITAKPSKIVAGQEPDKTNELLQAIGYALEQNIKSDDVVQTIRDGKPKTKPKGDIKPIKEKSNVGGGKRDEKKENDKSKPKKLENGAIKTIVEKKDTKIKTSRKTDKDLVSSDRSSKTISHSTNTKTKPVKEEKPTNHTMKPVKKERLLVRKSSTDKQNSSKTPTENENKEIVETTVAAKNDEVDSKQPIVLNGKKTEKEETVIVNNESIPKHQQLSREPSPKVDEKPREQPLKSMSPLKSGRKNSVDELSAIIDEEAERRKQERREKRSARQEKLRRPSMNDDSLLEFIKEEQKLDPETPKPTTPSTAAISRENSDVKPQSHTEQPTGERSLNKSASEQNISTPSYIRQKSGDLKNGRPRTSLRPPSVRPASARPGAPRRRDKNVEIVLQPEETLKLGEINVTVENFNAELEDDGENLIIMEDPENQTKDLLALKGDDDTNQQGHLVQQILETQKEFATIKNDVDSSGMGNEYEKNRTSSALKVDSLRDALQKLTKSVNPLGKLLDFLQEDIDSMERDLEKWTQTYKQIRVELNREKGLTETEIQPMKHQLAQIELNVKEHIDMINTSRANSLLNEQKIFKLLTE